MGIEQLIRIGVCKARNQYTVLDYLTEQKKLKQTEANSEKEGIKNGIQKLLLNDNESEAFRRWRCEIAAISEEESSKLKIRMGVNNLIYFSHFLGHRLIHTEAPGGAFLLCKNAENGKLIFQELEKNLNGLFIEFQRFPTGVHEGDGYHFVF